MWTVNGQRSGSSTVEHCLEMIRSLVVVINVYK